MKTVLSHANLIDRVEPNVRPDSAVLIEKVTLFWTELITVAHVGDLGLFAWDAIIEVARHDVVEAEELDIRVDPKRDASAVRPGQRKAAVDRDIGEGTVAARRHARAPEGGGKDYSRLSNLPKARAQADRQRN